MGYQAPVAAIEGTSHTVEGYMKYAQSLGGRASETYRYLNFDQIKNYAVIAGTVISDIEI